MEYFYSPLQNISPDSLTIEGDEFSHLTHVMRKKVGHEIVVVDGVGTAYQATIAEINKRTARCTIRQRLPRLHEPLVDVTLAVGILKNPSRFDFLVEKATELGVTCIIPILTERTIPRHAKTERWQKITLAAMKQCGRCVLPIVLPLTSFAEFIKNAKAELKLLAHEKSETSIDINTSATSIAICVGPEGGFTDEEVAYALENGFRQISLGERRLRTETATISALSKLKL